VGGEFAYTMNVMDMDDRSLMNRALMLASKARGKTSPNPMVGAVMVKDGRVIAEGYHRRPGTPHAEMLTIMEAGENARSSTLYINLEPCCHTEKRTPPCTRAILEAGIKKVVVAMKDPNPMVSGKGIRELKGAGVEITCGVLEEKARRLNESYVKYITTREPFVTLKVAMTLDGKIATPEGQSKWITGKEARHLVHRLRSSADAILTAIGTVKADDPELTARIRGGRNPLRVVIDPDIETPLDAKVLRTPPDTIIVAREKGSDGKIKKLEKTGIKFIFFKETLDLHLLARRLGEMGVTSVLVEGGSSLNAHAIEQGIVDKVMFFIAPKIIGGRDSFPSIGGKTFRRLDEAYSLRDMKVRRVGDDLLVEGYL
jgi:diaminohydroxyphosphoribosylaminopyrimidine deaminase / 5-amino-6-(5-phosphoribosylamino)uracil reductase